MGWPGPSWGGWSWVVRGGGRRVAGARTGLPVLVLALLASRLGLLLRSALSCLHVHRLRLLTVAIAVVLSSFLLLQSQVLTFPLLSLQLELGGLAQALRWRQGGEAAGESGETSRAQHRHLGTSGETSMMRWTSRTSCGMPVELVQQVWHQSLETRVRV